MNHDRHYARHIQEAGRRILDYTRDGRTAFEADLRTQDAVIRNIGVIGEAAGNLSEEFRLAHPTIPWKRIRGMRNELIHRYFRIDFELIWQVIEVFIFRAYWRTSSRFKTNSTTPREILLIPNLIHQGQKPT